MREVFEAFLTDPVRINEEAYMRWLDGRSADADLDARLAAAADVPAMGSAEQMRELLWRDTVDQYRLFEKLEHYVVQPGMLQSQLLFQIPAMQQSFLLEQYYALDGQIVRRLLGKKPSAKLQKDLDEISEQSQRSIKSCRRHLDNLQRVYGAMEERSFQGSASHIIGEVFSLSETLSSKYACVLFLLHGRFEGLPSALISQSSSVPHGGLSWHELLFVAALVMVHWVPQQEDPMKHRLHGPGTTAPSASESSVTRQDISSSPALPDDDADYVALRSSINKQWPTMSSLREQLIPTSVTNSLGLDLCVEFTTTLQEFSRHFSNDVRALRAYCQRVIAQLKHLRNVDLGTRLDDVVRALLAIAVGVSQPKELKDLLANVAFSVVRGLKECRVPSTELDDVFSALIDTLNTVEAWYLHGDSTRHILLVNWDRFLSVIRVLVVLLYDRVDT